MTPPIRWAIMWDGRLQWRERFPLLFLTREQARAYIRKKYGYIRHRPDLRGEPLNWRMPKAVRVRVILEPVEAKP